jgi:hypothetical protein
MLVKVHVKISENWRFFDFEVEQIVDARLGGAYFKKTDTLLRVVRVTLPKVLSAYTNHRKTVLAERDSPLTLRRAVSKNHRAATVGSEQN